MLFNTNLLEAKKVVRSLLLLTENLGPLPHVRYLIMKAHYTPDCPPEYTPKNFFEQDPQTESDTDSDGDAAANMLLSQKRATTIKTALVNNYGIEASRLVTEGKGETQPLNNNASAEEKAANRRAEFIKI